MSSSSRTVLCALLLAVLLACSSLPATSAQGCYPCVVSACAAYNNGTAPATSIGALSADIAAAECATLNGGIGGFIATAQNATCAASVAALACDVVLVTNQTEVACNASTLGIGTPLGNMTVFQQQCSAAVGCLGYTFQDELVAGAACSSFETFLAVGIAQPTPPSVPCAPCNIAACNGLSTIPGVTNVTFWAGSTPGLNGSSCAALQVIATNFLASGASGVPATAVQAAVCNPLAALATIDTQDACNAGELSNIYNEVLFQTATASNATWEAVCQPLLSSLFNATLVSRVVAAGYCVNPALGLDVYAAQYLAGAIVSASSASSSSSSSMSAPSSSSSTGAANTGAAVSNGTSPSSTAAPSGSSSSVATAATTATASTATVVVSSSSAQSVPTAATSTVATPTQSSSAAVAASSGPGAVKTANAASTVYTRCAAGVAASLLLAAALL